MNVPSSFYGLKRSSIWEGEAQERTKKVCNEKGEGEGEGEGEKRNSYLLLHKGRLISTATDRSPDISALNNKEACLAAFNKYYLPLIERKKIQQSIPVPLSTLSSNFRGVKNQSLLLRQPLRDTEIKPELSVLNKSGFISKLLLEHGLIGLGRENFRFRSGYILRVEGGKPLEANYGDHGVIIKFNSKSIKKGETSEVLSMLPFFPPLPPPPLESILNEHNIKADTNISGYHMIHSSKPVSGKVIITLQHSLILPKNITEETPDIKVIKVDTSNLKSITILGVRALANSRHLTVETELPETPIFLIPIWIKG